MKKYVVAMALLAPCLYPGSGLAQTPVDADFLNCRAVSNDAARLSCYDALADSLSKTSAERQEQQKSAVAAAKKTAEENFGRREKPGDEGLKIADSVTPEARAIIEAAKEPDEITAKVARVDESSTGRIIVYLDNDQIWMETSASRFRGKLPEGEVATISKGGLGWFRMRFKDTYGVMAVKRVK